jgi:hypothetical protein
MCDVHIFIISGSQAALRAVRVNVFNSKLSAECLGTLNKLTTNCKLTLMSAQATQALLDMKSLTN